MQLRAPEGDASCALLSAFVPDIADRPVRGPRSATAVATERGSVGNHLADAEPAVLGEEPADSASTHSSSASVNPISALTSGVT
jgi:hypothetical protein